MAPLSRMVVDEFHKVRGQANVRSALQLRDITAGRGRSLILPLLQKITSVGEIM